MDACWWRARGGPEDTLSPPTLSPRERLREARPSMHHRRARHCSGATVAATGKRDETPALMELTF